MDEIRDAASTSWAGAPQNWNYHQHVTQVFWGLAEKLGRSEVCTLYRHANCGRTRHPASGYAFEDNHLAIKRNDDERYRFRALFSLSGRRPCPCGNRSRYDAHKIEVVLAFPVGILDFHQRQLIEVLEHLGNSVELSDRSRPRSAIREALLRCILTLNDCILPQTVDQFVEQYIGKRKNV